MQGRARPRRHPPARTPGHRRAVHPGGYAQLALVLALLVDAPEQLPLGRLRAAVRAAEPGAVPAAAPGDLAMALAALADWQVLTGVPADPADEDAVLTVDRELARAVPAGPPALAADAADLIHRAAEAEPGTAVRRRLAETPAVLVADLPEDQRAWLREHRHSGPAALAEFLGLEAESRAEGVALLDPAEELTDLVLPGPGTLAHAALLLVERLVEEVRPLPGEPEEDAEAAGGEPAVPVVPVPDALIDGVLGDIADEYGLPAGWRRDYLADRTALRRDALDLLHRMGLITPTPAAPVRRAGCSAPPPPATPPRRTSCRRRAPAVTPAATRRSPSRPRRRTRRAAGLDRLDDQAVSAQPFHVIHIGREDGDIAGLAQRDGCEHGIDGVLVPVQAGLGEQVDCLVGDVLGDGHHDDPGQYPLPGGLIDASVMRFDERHRGRDDRDAVALCVLQLRAHRAVSERGL
ncbi:DUF2398 family protein [Kitasatospora aburaviensis]